MTSPRKTLVLLLLFASALIHTDLLTRATSASPPTTRHRIIYMTSMDFDYDDPDEPENYEMDVQPSAKTLIPLEMPMPCQYNSCLENQEPCDSLAAKTGCLCPGMSGSDETPQPPRINALLPIAEGGNRGKIEVQWCAPSSEVSTYRVVVDGSGSKALEFGKDSRKGVIDSVEVGTKVCVEAVNSAGHSDRSDFSCKRYDLSGSSDSQLLVWVIGGGVALLLLLVVISVISWRRQMCRKTKRHSNNGLGNPTYST